MRPIIEGRRYCGAKAKHGGLCRAHPIPGRARCRMHGGNNYGARTPHKADARTWDARAAAQATYRRLGIPWHGGHSPTHGRRVDKRKALARMDKALDIGRAMLEVIPPAGGDDVRGRLAEGMRQALELQVAAVAMVKTQLDANGAEVDLGLLRVGCEQANAVFKNGIRLLEQDFQKRKLDRLGDLLERIAAAKRPD